MKSSSSSSSSLVDLVRGKSTNQRDIKRKHTASLKNSGKIGGWETYNAIALLFSDVIKTHRRARISHTL